MGDVRIPISLSISEKLAEFPCTPFPKGGTDFASLRKREAGRDVRAIFQTDDRLWTPLKNRASWQRFLIYRIIAFLI
jgi:hypothetical protein